MGQNLTGQLISATYEDLVQISGSRLTDGTGSNIDNLTVTASSATNSISASFASIATSASFASTSISASFATTASFALNAGGAINTGSFYVSSSVTNATITFNQGDGTTEAVTVNNVVNANSASLAANATSASFATNTISASFATTAISASQAGNANTAISSSFATNSTTATSASFATTSVSASFATTAISASHALNSNVAISASFATNSTSASQALNANTAISSSQASNANTAISSSFATNATSAATASFLPSTTNLNITSITASGASFTNLFATSASFGYVQTVTGSAVIIGDAFIILNADTPAAAFAGIQVYDTGSASTASFEWNGNTDNWIVVEEAGASAMVLTGLTGSKGSELAPALNKLLKGTGNHTIADSTITDNGSLVTIQNSVSASGFISASQFVGDLIGTASFATTATSASFATTASFAATAISASFASTASFVVTAQTASFFSLAAVTQNAVFSGSVRGDVDALSISSLTASLDCSTGNFFTLLLVSGSNTFVNPSNIQPGQTINLRVKQASVSSGSISFASSVKQVSGSAYQTTGTGSAEDIVTFVSFDSTNLYLANVKNFN